MSPPVIDIDEFQKGVVEAWKSISVANVNGNRVRFRVMQKTGLIGISMTIAMNFSTSFQGRFLSIPMRESKRSGWANCS